MPNQPTDIPTSYTGDDYGSRTTVGEGSDSTLEERSQSEPSSASYMSLPHKDQLAVLMLARITESLAASSIQSYIFFQLKYFDPSASAATISIRSGLLVGAKTAAHVCTGMLWGRLADSEYGGRKVVLAIGLISSSIAMLGYGFASSFLAAITWQVIDGTLSSTVSMVRCITADINPEKRYRTRALTLLPLCANAGSLLGPLIGGFLASPNKKNNLVQKYPYALPNIVVSLIHAISALVVILWLMEPSKYVLRSEQSLLARKWSWLSINNSSFPVAAGTEESQSLLANVQNMPRPVKKPILPFRRIWTFNVLSTMFAHFIISGHLGTFSNLWAIFLSVPREEVDTQHPPFHFSGGLGMNPRGVGMAMALLGAIGVILQIIIYPTLNDRYGTIRLWRAALFIFPITYIIAPFCAQVSSYNPQRTLVWGSITIVLLLFIGGRIGLTPATSLIINDCTPHPSVRGTIHTAGTMVGNLSRSIFPTAALAIFGYGLRIRTIGLGFWFIAFLAILACVASRWVVEGSNGNEIVLEEDQERGEEEQQQSLA